MKINSTNTANPPPFNPIKLEITFESQTEADTFAALFNISGVCDLNPICPGWNNFCHSIRRALDTERLQNPACCVKLYNDVSEALETFFKKL